MSLQLLRRSFLHQAFQVQHPDDVVQTIAVHRQARKASVADRGKDLRPFVIQFDTDDFVVGHHDVVNRDLFEFENCHQHSVALLREQCTRFIHQQAQLIDAE